MAEKYGFFDAVVTNGVADRIYSADDINHIFSGMLTDGIFRLYANALHITAGNGLSVNVDTGKAIVKDHWYLNTTVKNVTFTPAHVTLSRYSSVVLRYNRANRSVVLASIDGVPASDPVIPELTQTNDIYEIRIANVLISGGAISVSDENITDVRTYTSGIVDVPEIDYRRYDTVQSGYSDGQRYFDIPASYNFTPNSKLEVYCNGLLCRSDEYTIQVNEVEVNYMVVFTEKRALGTELSFIMLN